MPAKKVKKPSEVSRVVTEVIKPKAEPAAKIKEATPKHKAPSRARKAPAPSKKYYVVIDHPGEGEILSGLQYTIRIGASEGGTVDISIDNSDWFPCRKTAGYWWYDWGYFFPGNHKIVTRLRTQAGKTLKKSEPRVCVVA